MCFASVWFRQAFAHLDNASRAAAANATNATRVNEGAVNAAVDDGSKVNVAAIDDGRTVNDAAVINSAPNAAVPIDGSLLRCQAAHSVFLQRLLRGELGELDAAVRAQPSIREMPILRRQGGPSHLGSRARSLWIQ